jgi:acetylglutamate/LysW-gamma-L-alpha-aminoadipate kinase
VTGTVVVKCGGALTEAPDDLCADIADVVADGLQVVLVHGGSVDIDEVSESLGVPQRRLEGPGGVSGRYTDDATMQAVTLALAGAVKPRMVTSLTAHDVPALGLTGLDLGLVRAKRKKPFRARVDGRPQIVRDDHSGRITAVQADPLRLLLGQGIVPVLSPPALDGDELVNVDADRMAAAVAKALDADELIVLSAVPGVLADVDDPTSLLDACELPTEGAVPFSGAGMGAKLTAAREAATADVAVRIADGRGTQPITDALDGAGTRIVLEEEPHVDD